MCGKENPWKYFCSRRISIHSCLRAQIGCTLAQIPAKLYKYVRKFLLLFRLRSLVSMPFLWPPYLCNISALSLFSLVISYLVAFFCFRSTGSWTQDVAEDLYAQNWGCGGSFAQASKKPPCNQIKGPSLVW